MTHSTQILRSPQTADCAMHGCPYNETIGQMDSGGYCVCQEQFCETHFKTHQCFQNFQENLNECLNNLKNR